MRRSLLVVAAAAALITPAFATSASARPAAPDNAVNGSAQAAAVHVCPAPPAGYASCHALRNDGKSGGNGKPAPAPSAPTRGLFPDDLQAAYNIAAAAAGEGLGKTIAIVDAYDAPNVAKDLNVYRSQFNLPPLDGCTVSPAGVSSKSSHPCFAKINQRGGNTAPRANGGWAQEISLDVDMASAICPQCNILLVEADSNSFANLAAAVDRAAIYPGVVAISNSYGGGEYSNEVADQSHYNHPGIAVTVSSGDNGFGAEFPAASQYVTAVGGTTLEGSLDGSWSETAWDGSGSGCSAYVTQPDFQAGTTTGCSRRAIADVSAVADPATGVAVYDSYSYQGMSGWMMFGGTSAAAPIVAGVFALSGNTSATAAGLPYSATGGLRDVTSGSNGTCSVTLWCNAGRGYDGPTGLGTPNGVGAF